MTNSISKNKKKEKTSSAVDDCADVTSKYKRFKEKEKKADFEPINYEKPPHY
jgi:epoxyqueuosine reductase QueG